MRLFIAEKPSLGRAIANGLGNQKKSDGCIHCGDDMVTWCFGHMLMDAMPEDYSPDFRQWRKSSLPIIPKEWKSLVKKDSAKQLKIIGSLLRDASSVVNAGDPDREGQLLVDEVLEHFNYKGKVERIWLASLDDASVKKAISRICDNSKYLPLRDAARARVRADWLVGINATRAMTIMGRQSGRSDVLSLGRVQTPTLALVVSRDNEIANFRPKDYFVLKGCFTNDSGEFEAVSAPDESQAGLDEAGRLIDPNVADNLVKHLSGKDGEIIAASREQKTKAAPLPHCLSSLQKAASAKLGMSAQEVLDTAQKLYEKKLATYPRTDCRYLPEEQFPDAANVLKTLSSITDLEKIAGNTDVNIKSPAWNTKKVTAHHAIIPTGENPEGLSGKEHALYLMIASAYCLQFYHPLRYEAQKLTVSLESAIWEAKGRKILEPDWTVAEKDDDDEDAGSSLPDLEKGHVVKCLEISLQKKKTSPPAKFTEGTLIEAMANVHRFVSDEDAKAQLKEAKGIGTEATRAKVIETLKERKYLIAEKKSLVSTPLGRELISLAPQNLKDPISTAEQEARLEAIASGRESLDGFLEEQCRNLPDLLAPILDCRIKSDHVCPQCGAALIRRKRKTDGTFFWGCSAYPDCKTVLPDDKGKPGKPRIKSELSSHLCPSCGRPLVKRIGKNGEFYGCSGYPECKRTFQVVVEGSPDFSGKNRGTCRECGGK